MSTTDTDAETSGDSGDEIEIDIEFDRYTQQMQDDERLHTDADSMRRHFGVSAYIRERFDYPNVYPNLLEHFNEGEGPPTGASADKGGTDLLIKGKPGKGKSTYLCHHSLRTIEINEDEAVIWKGSPSRSEWLPLAPWTRLCLPASADITATVKPPDPLEDAFEVDLRDIVREVYRYDDLEDLFERCVKPGMFHVVYADPEMRGAQEAYEASPEKTYDDLEFSREDPLNHWWFAAILYRIEHARPIWMTMILDEIGDLAPQDARADDFGTYQKIEMLKDSWVDARKTNLSLVMAGHSESDIHEKIRKKVRWRLQMPAEANPTSKSEVVGFGSVPMKTDLTSRLQHGEILCYTETNYELLAYPHYPSPLDGKLQISLD